MSSLNFYKGLGGSILIPSDFRDMLLVGIGSGLFSDRNVVPGSTKDVDP